MVIRKHNSTEVVATCIFYSKEWGWDGGRSRFDSFGLDSAMKLVLSKWVSAQYWEGVVVTSLSGRSVHKPHLLLSCAWKKKGREGDKRRDFGQVCWGFSVQTHSSHAFQSWLPLHTALPMPLKPDPHQPPCYSSPDCHLHAALPVPHSSPSAPEPLLTASLLLNSCPLCSSGSAP